MLSEILRAIKTKNNELNSKVSSGFIFNNKFTSYSYFFILEVGETD
jgi:hypothetical protein